MIWVIRINGAHGKIDRYDRLQRELISISEIFNENIHLKNQDINADKPGRYQTSLGAHSAYEPRTDSHEAELIRFIKIFVKEVEQGRIHQYFTKLIVIAAPHINGLLHLEFSKPLMALVMGNIKKDFTEQSEKILEHYLNENWLSLPHSVHN